MSSETPARDRPPALLCYDGSDAAGRAIEQAGELLGGGPAIVLCVWESLGSALLRHPSALGTTEIGRDLREMTEDVVEEMDSGTARRAEATAEEGVRRATAAGFDATPLAQRALARMGERDEVTIWQALLETAEAEDARVLVLGSRGRSGLRSMVLGSVSYGVVHHSQRPLLIVPAGAGEPPAEGGEPSVTK